MPLQSIPGLIDRRIAELQMARSLLVQCESFADSEILKHIAFSSSRTVEVQKREIMTASVDPVQTKAVESESGEVSLDNNSSKKTATKQSDVNAKRMFQMMRDDSKGMSPLHGSVPVGPVVVAPRRQVAREVPSPEASMVLDQVPQSFLGELMHEVAVRVGTIVPLRR